MLQVTGYRLQVKKEKGQTLLVVLGIIIILLIFIPALVYYVQQEAKWTIKGKRTTTAFHLAEAGIERGYWKLTESDSYWDIITKDEQQIDGYKGDSNSIYSDLAGGKYKINIFKSGVEKVTIRSQGQDDSTQEVRTIEAVYSRKAIDSAIDAESTVEYKPGLKVHWGPVKTYTSIEQAPQQYYPRKFSKGRIVGRDIDPTSPNSDEIEYWAFDDELGQPAEINLAYYIAKATSSSVPPPRKATGVQAANASPSGSGYFTESVKFRQPGAGGGAYTFTSSTSVIFVNGNADMEVNTWLDVEALIVTGNVDFNARSSSYAATIPENASEEYQHPEALATWATFPGNGQPYAVTNCGMHGFLYVGGDLKDAAGGGKIVGVIRVKGELQSNTFTIYFDQNSAERIETQRSSIERDSWREVYLSW